MTRLFRIAVLTGFVLLTACIRNDIPYPQVELQIEAVEGEGFTASIDPALRTVTLKLDETTDIRNVRIEHIAATEGASLSCGTSGVYDLRSPLYVTLSLYQEYVWTIRAEQQIERRFRVAGQIGAEQIDATNHIARAQVASNVDLEHIEVTTLKLGPEGITDYSPAVGTFADADFRTARRVDVTCHGRTEQWWLFVEQTDSKIAVGATDAWHNTATITATVSAEEYATGAAIQYRVKESEEWIDAQESGYEGGILTATVTPEWNSSTNGHGITVHTPVPMKGFFAGRTYEIRLMIGQTESQVLEYAAADGDTIPNGDMEGTLSCFTTDNTASTMWGSGNNSLKPYLCSPAEGLEGAEGVQCAKLSASKTLGILASGNLFTGTFRMSGTNGTVGFGQQFNYTARPTALHVRYHATVGKIDVNRFGELAVGSQDISSIYVAIVDWSARHEVTSGTSNPIGAWDPAAQSDLEGSGRILAYGILDIDSSTPGSALIEEEIPLYYYDTGCDAPQGSYTLVISCSTSKYGDFMDGCSTNVLYVDDFRWSY